MTNDQLLAIYLHKEFVKRGAQLNTTWTAWMMQDTLDVAWARYATPQRISMIVREIQSQASEIRTMSITLPADVASEMVKSVQDIMRQEEEMYRTVIREGRANASDYRQLAYVLIQQGELREAEQKARAAVAVDEKSAEAWDVLGWTLVKRNEFKEARDAFKRSLALNPNSVLTLFSLAVCYENLGDETLAREFHIRAISLSGGELPFQ